MGDKVRVGMVGTSWWSDWMHLPSLASHDAVELAAICGRREEPAQQMAEKFNIPKVYTDYRQMIDEVPLDAVAMATPDDTHFDIAMAVLDKGLHFLSEKPIANTLAEAEAIAAKAEEKGVRHLTLFSWRWAPIFAELKKQLEAGAVGRPLEARFAFLGTDAFGPEYGWRRDGRRCNGTLADFGAHMIDFVHWYLGDIESVAGTIFTHIDRKGLEPVQANDCATLDLMTMSGVHVVMPLNMAARIGDQVARIDIDIYGDEGGIEAQLILFGSEGGGRMRRCKQDQPFETIYETRFDPNFSERPDFFRPYIESSAGPRAFIDAILEDRPASPDLNDGLAAQRVIAAAFEASESGRRVKV